MSEDTMLYVALPRGFKPGGSNLTFGFTEEEDAIAGRPVAPAMASFCFGYILEYLCDFVRFVAILL